MKKNICGYIETDGITCKNPQRDGICRGKCEDYFDDLEDLCVDIDDRKATTGAY